jgi:hypothetical protein
VEIEDWSGKRGRFFGVPNKIVFLQTNSPKKRTAQRILELRSENEKGYVFSFS